MAHVRCAAAGGVARPSARAARIRTAIVFDSDADLLKFLEKILDHISGDLASELRSVHVGMTEMHAAVDAGVGDLLLDVVELVRSAPKRTDC